MQEQPGPRRQPTSELRPWEIQEGKQLKGRQSSKMTSNCRYFINTTCAKFSECCQLYPCVNTGLFTSRTFKGVDKSDGLNNKGSQPGSETVSLYPQLGTTHHTRLMGPASNNRVSTGAYPGPTSDETGHGNKVLSGGAYQNITRGLRPSDQGCYSLTQVSTGSYVSQIFLVEKKGGDRGQ